MCPNSVDTPPPNNPTGKPIRPRDQLSQPASHQREAYQLPALSAGVAYGSPGGLPHLAVNTYNSAMSHRIRFSIVVEDVKRNI